MRTLLLRGIGPHQSRASRQWRKASAARSHRMKRPAVFLSYTRWLRPLADAAGVSSTVGFSTIRGKGALSPEEIMEPTVFPPILGEALLATEEGCAPELDTSWAAQPVLGDSSATLACHGRGGRLGSLPMLPTPAKHRS